MKITELEIHILRAADTGRPHWVSNFNYEKLHLLVLYPEIGRLSLIDPTVRMVKIGKSYLMFYRCDGYELIIVDFFNTRQDPNLRKY